MFYSIEFGKHNLEDVAQSAAPGDSLLLRMKKRKLIKK
jgi:hypothetical protein